MVHQLAHPHHLASIGCIDLSKGNTNFGEVGLGLRGWGGGTWPGHSFKA